ncbi:uncharacterized protein [Mycetomoellerius zeteki]|nr:PREDICTED: uncharacterized protein LOC108722350 [Trachymyrmex zeteki]
MEIEDIDNLRDFVTIYKKHYLGKRGKRTTMHKLLPKYLPSSNILNRPYKQYLHTRLENRLLSENERSEDPVDNLNRIRDKFPHLRNALPKIVPDEIVIKNNKEKSMKTIYQQDYSKEFQKGHSLLIIIISIIYV